MLQYHDGGDKGFHDDNGDRGFHQGGFDGEGGGDASGYVLEIGMTGYVDAYPGRSYCSSRCRQGLWIRHSFSRIAASLIPRSSASLSNTNLSADTALVRHI